MDNKDQIYGSRAVIEAMESDREVEKILIQKGLQNELVKEVVRNANKYKIPVQYVPAEKLRRISTKNHQGVIGYISAVSYASVDNIIDRAYSAGRDPFLLILDRVTDVRNFGAIARTAECLGVDGIVIPAKGSALINADAVKTSAGALNHIPVCREASLVKLIKNLQANGIRCIALSEKGADVLFDGELSGPIAIIMGSEEDGVSNEIIRICDNLYQIPMTGKVESLNVSVSAGIALYEVVRHRRLNVS